MHIHNEKAAAPFYELMEFQLISMGRIALRYEVGRTERIKIALRGTHTATPKAGDSLISSQ